MGISVSCTALLAIIPFICLSTVFLSTGEKQKLELSCEKRRIVLMLGWFLYFIMLCRALLLDNRLWRSFPHLHSEIFRFLTFKKK